MNKIIAVYPGTFDPFTLGHYRIVERACRLVDELIVLISINPEKVPTFSLQERFEMIRVATSNLDNVKIVINEGFTIEKTKELGAKYIFKAIRNVKDLEDELRQDEFNTKVDNSIQTILLNSEFDYMNISSSLVKQKAKDKQDYKDLVNESIYQIIKAKLG